MASQYISKPWTCHQHHRHPPPFVWSSSHFWASMRNLFPQFVNGLQWLIYFHKSPSCRSIMASRKVKLLLQEVIFFWGTSPAATPVRESNIGAGEIFRGPINLMSSELMEVLGSASVGVHKSHGCQGGGGDTWRCQGSVHVGAGPPHQISTPTSDPRSPS